MLGDFIHTKFGSKTKGKGKSKVGKKEETELTKKYSDNEPIISKKTKIAPKVDKKDDDHREKHDHNLAHQIKEKFQEFIGHVDHLPAFLKDNEFIHTGYRINFSTPKKVLKSLFMVHNESVNIWSHLGGAIILIIICLGLGFSMNAIDTHNLKQYVQNGVKDLFEPVYDRLPDFSQIELDLSEKINQTKDDISKLGENTAKNLESTMESISQEIESAKNNINPEAIGRLLNKVKTQLESFGDAFDDMKHSVSNNLNKNKLGELSKTLKKELNDLQNQLIHKIDSSDFDWIDIYRYINTNYSDSSAFREGHIMIPLSRWPIIVFLSTAVFCLLCSATFHLFYCLSQRANEILLRLDYAGISILITGSSFPALVYGFYCQPFFAKLYLTIIGTTSIVVFFVSLGDKIHTNPYRHLKSSMYGGLGVFSGLPIIHLLYLTLTETNGNLDFVSSLPYYLAMGVSYLGGLTIYSFKCPERYKPGKFDICGHSHQIWHICVLMGIILTYFGAFDNYYTRMKIPCIGCEA